MVRSDHRDVWHDSFRRVTGAEGNEVVCSECLRERENEGVSVLCVCVRERRARACEEARRKSVREREKEGVSAYV